MCRILFDSEKQSGGTSMCKLLESSKYKVEAATKNCNCEKYLLSLEAVSVSLEKAIRGAQGRDACFVERGFGWPSPENFHRLMTGFEGGVVTVMRDPWSRFKSNYEKDFSECGPRCEFNTPREFAQIGEHRHYGGTLYSRPNFYVRMLNGLAGDHPWLRINRTHLAAAKNVLQRFDAIIFLEQNASQRSEVIKYITSGRKNTLPEATNNILSSHFSGKVKMVNRPPDAEPFRKEFMKNNEMDYELYDWAVQQFTSDDYMRRIRQFL